MERPASHFSHGKRLVVLVPVPGRCESTGGGRIYISHKERERVRKGKEEEGRTGRGRGKEREREGEEREGGDGLGVSWGFVVGFDMVQQS